MELSPEIYAWLVSIDILDDSVYDKQKDINNKINYPQYPNLPASVANFEFGENGNIKLSQTVTRQITIGTFFPKLFSKMNILMNELYGNIYKLVAMFASCEVTKRLEWETNIFYYLSFCIFEFCSIRMHHQFASF